MIAFSMISGWRRVEKPTCMALVLLLAVGLAAASGWAEEIADSLSKQAQV